MLNTTQQRNQTFTINFSLLAGRDSAQFKEGWIEINRHHGHFTQRPSFRDTRSTDKKSFSDSTFVNPTFPTTQRQVTRGRSFRRRKPTVVACETDNRIFGQFQFIQCGQDLSNGGVHGLNHRGIGGMRLQGANFTLLGIGPHLFLITKYFCARQSQTLGFFLILGNQIARRHQRCMYGIEGKVSEKWLLLVCSDETDCFISKSLSQVLTFRAILQPGVRIGRKVLSSLEGPPSAVSTHVHVESLMFRPKLFCWPEMPFSRKECRVPGCFRGLSQGPFFQRHAIVQSSWQETPCAITGKEIRGINTTRVLPRQDTVSRW